MAPAPLLVVRGLSKRLGTVQALENASFSIRRGEILGLIGPNGAGKSTLFHCVAGLMPADAGSVTVDGAPLAEEARKGSMFLMPDGIRPWPGHTLGQALGYMAAMHECPPHRAAAHVETLGLGSLLRSRLEELSKGEHKRALLAMSLLSRPELLLLDEPFDGLDLRQTRDAMALLRAERDGGRTLFLSIHQLMDASRICDRFVLMSAGRTIAEGTLQELHAATALPGEHQPDLESLFLALT